MTHGYVMRCPNCGEGRLYTPATCLVEVSSLDDKGNFQIIPENTIRLRVDFDGALNCGNPICCARFWDISLAIAAPA